MFFGVSSLRRRHARQRAAGRAVRRAQWEVWYFDHALSAGALRFERFPLLTSVKFTGSCYKKKALRWCFRRRADRARQKKGADHRPSARRWPDAIKFSYQAILPSAIRRGPTSDMPLPLLIYIYPAAMLHGRYEAVPETTSLFVLLWRTRVIRHEVIFHQKLTKRQKVK